MKRSCKLFKTFWKVICKYILIGTLHSTLFLYKFYRQKNMKAVSHLPSLGWQRADPASTQLTYGHHGVIAQALWWVNHMTSDSPRDSQHEKAVGCNVESQTTSLNLYLNGRLSWFNCAIHFLRVCAGVLQEDMLLLGGAGQTVDYPVASPALCCPCWRRRQSPGTDSAGRTTTWLVMCFQHHYHRENTFLIRRIIIEW